MFTCHSENSGSIPVPTGFCSINAEQYKKFRLVPLQAKVALAEEVTAVEREAAAV